MKTDINISNLNCRNCHNYYSAYTKTEQYVFNDNNSYGRICWGDAIDNSVIRKTLVVPYLKLDIQIRPGSLITGPAGSSSKHGCLFDKNFIKEYLKEISETYFEFKYTLNEQDKGFLLTIIFEDKTRKEILWILNLIRHLYEFPFNAFLNEAISLRKLDEFKDEHLTNLLQVVATSSRADYYRDQSLGYLRKKLVTPDIIKSKLRKGRNVSSCYSIGLKKEVSKTIKQLPIKRDIGESKNISVNSYAYWFDHQVKEFEDLKIQTYLDNYKILKGE